MLPAVDAAVPAPQLTQQAISVPPVVDVEVPARQSVQAETPGEFVPIHLPFGHAVQDWAVTPSPPYFPAGQFEQSAAAVAPVEKVLFPRAHTVQEPAAAADHVPKAHSLQEAPDPALYVPAAQSVHTVLRASDVDFPEEHVAQTDSPVVPPYFAAGQSRQAAVEVPPVDGLYVPTGHALQAAAVFALLMLVSQNLPASQSVQTVAKPSAVYFPEAQAVQILLPPT